MDFNSFIRYLAFLRWSRVFAFVFAFAGCFIIGYYFFIEQKNHRQTLWEFKNISHVHSGTMELEPDRIYEIKWDRLIDKSVVPTELYVDGAYYDTLDYFALPYKAQYRRTTYCYINKHIPNPMRIRVNKLTTFGIIFRVYTNHDFSEDPAGFFGKWFDSWFDPVRSIDWTVRDITDSYNNGYLTFDGTIELTFNK